MIQTVCRLLNQQLLPLEALLFRSQEDISETGPNSHSEDDLGSILRHLNG